MPQFNSLPDYLPFLNQQIDFQELLSEYLFQIDSMFEVALTSSSFLYQKKTTIQYYFSTISDIVIGVKNLNENQLKNLNHLASLMKKTDPPAGGGTIH